VYYFLLRYVVTILPRRRPCHVTPRGIASLSKRHFAAL